MATFVVYAGRNPEVLARLVLLFDRRDVEISSFVLEPAHDPLVLRMIIRSQADEDKAHLIEANLHKLVDVLLVERSDRIPSVESGTGPSTGGRHMKIIYVVTTGGTIEKMYFGPTGSVVNLESKIDRYLQLLRLPGSDVHVVPLLNKDSLEMTDRDRDLIAGTLKALMTEGAPIIVTHGTDTMIQTGLYLQRLFEDVRVPIVLTGAMIPFGFEGSDGLQNLTESLFAAHILSPGIYVVMHGQSFPVDRVKKDYELARFLSTGPELA